MDIEVKGIGRVNDMITAPPSNPNEIWETFHSAMNGLNKSTIQLCEIPKGRYSNKEISKIIGDAIAKRFFNKRANYETT